MEEKEENEFLKKKRKLTTSEGDEYISSFFSNNSKSLSQNNSKKIRKIKNRKRMLRNKLEFLLSDVNLYHDKYLKNIYLSNNEGITPEIFLTFNSIEILLNDIKKEAEKKNLIIKAIGISHKLVYNKIANHIERIKPYNENLINIEFIDKCTIYIQNLPPLVNHELIYELFKDYKILYINLLKAKNRKLTGEAFIILNNIEDVNKIIEKYNNSIPKIISSLNPKILKPLKIMKKEEYLKNKIINDNNNQINYLKKINENKNNINIDENNLIKINNIKENLTLKEAKNCIYNIAFPLFIDINNKEKSLILRFDTKKNSDLFLEKLKENNYENLKDIINIKEEDKKNFIKEFDDKERKEYIDLVKLKIDNYKEKKDKEKEISKINIGDKEK